jgi:hypothetical protein
MDADQYLPDIDFLRLAGGRVSDEVSPLVHMARQSATLPKLRSVSSLLPPIGGMVRRYDPGNQADSVDASRGRPDAG